MNWPDLDMTAIINRHEATSSRWCEIPPVLASVLMRITSNVRPDAKYRVIMPVSRPTSPTRLVRNALRAASEFGFSSHQWPMRANEQRPTNSQPTIIWRVLGASTKKSIDAVNRLRKAKKWV
jgi:hypothetical protein